ncbi:MAG TPA: alpha/beta fold hydrolase [Ilumatobacteraceae bacterium]|nr:alpha/beta fold hydrolase [Ilumatobacteraceae bacterium]
MTASTPLSAEGTTADATPAVPDADTWRRWGLDPAWSRLIDVASHEGGTHRWHVLDTGMPSDHVDSPTVVCVHGNPTWGYAWASFLRRLHRSYRVVAVDQLGMGYSERTRPRRYTDRVRDLDDVIVALDLARNSPLVVAAHDWGGAIAMGWAVQDPKQVAGLILCNTGIAVPDGRSAPGIIRLAASPWLLDVVCRGTPTFVEGTVRLSGRRITKVDREAFRAPYRSAPARAAIADFVGDIPLQAGHPSEAALAEVADRLASVTAPVLLAWGDRDPVFNDDFAADLAGRFPNSTTHRFGRANHLVMAEADVAAVAETWLGELFDGRLRAVATGTAAQPMAAASAAQDDPTEPLWGALDERRDDSTEAFVDLATGDAVSFAELARRVDAVASELRRRGLQPGDHVAMLTPPGVDLVAAVYGVWRAGGVTVIADRGLGLRGLGRAVRSARPKFVIGPRQARLASAALRWTPRATRLDVADLVAAPADGLGAAPLIADPAAVLFTSGATGPAKGVRYTHGQLAAQRDALASTYSITSADRLVAAFAPFALYGPALGIPTALPDVDVTKPGELTADALDAACGRIGATLAFASPAALANVAATAQPGARHDGLEGLRVVFSAGAPVPSGTLRAIAALASGASLHTPYGMTEVLPVADIDLDAIELAERDDPRGGVCVGRPVAGAEVRIAALGFDAEELPAELEVGAMGEILVRAPWVSDGYLGLWATQREARPGTVGDWHRSGDVGHLDALGRLWVEGRVVHVIDGADGPVTSVSVERQVERSLGVGRVAAVGVGPAGSQQLVVVVEDPSSAEGPADRDTAIAVRQVLSEPVASVLTVSKLPVDIRHNAKIDRVAVASWADDVLAGRRTRSLARHR